MQEESGQLWETSRGVAVSVAVRDLAGGLVRLRQGTISDGDFRPTRTMLGVYGQRQPEQYMIRVRLPYGAITASQLRLLAHVAMTYGSGAGHFTTRQDMQLHWLPLDAMPDILKQLGDTGLITLQAGGNSVRNVAACPLAGACATEAFDVGPYAAAVDASYVGNPTVQSLPRKFKSSFSGCTTDCGLSAIQDFGAVAVTRTVDGQTQRGFRVYAGGGLGSTPRPAALVDDFVPAAEVLATYEATIRVFARLGDRTRKDRARLKYVVARLGEAEFRRLVREEREALRQEGHRPPIIGEDRPSEPHDVGEAPARASDPQYERWLRWNTIPQRQPDRHSVTIGLPLGDITSAQMEAVAALAERHPAITLRATVQQNLTLRGLTPGMLPAVYETLSAAGLTSLRANGVADVTSCPGTSACSLGIAASKGLARQLQQLLQEGPFQDDDALSALRIKVSGCTDSCSQHQLADLGFCGAAVHQDGRLYPAYILYLGGKVDADGTRLGQPIVKLPARKVPQAVKLLLSFYQAERRDGETFASFVDRFGARAFRTLLSDVTQVPPVTQDPSNFIDWDATRMYVLERGEGECAV